jgi:hypothetical protein
MTMKAPLWPMVLGSFHGQGSSDKVDMVEGNRKFLEGIVCEFVFLKIEVRKVKGHRVVASGGRDRR